MEKAIAALGPRAAEIIRALDEAGFAIVPLRQTPRQEGARILNMKGPREGGAREYAAQVEAGRVWL